MERKAIIVNNIQGMERDLNKNIPGGGSDVASGSTVYEIYNMRHKYDEKSFLSLTNEKIPELISSVKGIVIGKAIIKDFLILFAIDDDETFKKDIIYKYSFESYNPHPEAEILYKGNLNFNKEHPIETIPLYETEDLLKIYWIDGINQPRVININDEKLKNYAMLNSDYFNFLPDLSLYEDIQITKNPAGGVFNPGTVQYFCTYVNKNAQESNIFYISPLFYTSTSEKGTSPEDKTSNSFTFSLSGLDFNYDLLRVYAIHRSSINTTPEGRLVAELSIPELKKIQGIYAWTLSTQKNLIYDNKDILSSYKPSDNSTPEKNYYKIPGIEVPYLQHGEYFYKPNIEDLTGGYWEVQENKVPEDKIEGSFIIFFKKEGLQDIYQYAVDKVSFIDTGYAIANIDPYEILLKTKSSIIPKAFDYKQDTLFLGNYNLEMPSLQFDIWGMSFPEYIKTSSINFKNTEKKIKASELNTHYSHENQLKENSQTITTFKYHEWYRFGVQFQYKTGEWSSPFWIKDAQNLLHPNTSLNTITKKEGDTFEEKFQDEDITLVSAEGEIFSKATNALIEEGFIAARPVIVYPTLNDKECVCQGILCPTIYNIKDRLENLPFSQSSWFARPNAPFSLVLPDEEFLTPYKYDSTDKDRDLFTPKGIMYNENYTDNLRKELIDWGSFTQFKHGYSLFGGNQRSREIQGFGNHNEGGQGGPGETFESYSSYIIHNPDVSDSKNRVLDWVNKVDNEYFIDQSIITLHSPEIEFNEDLKNIDLSSLKLRIIGMVPITSCASDLNIVASETVNGNFPGFVNHNIGTINKFATLTSREGQTFHGWKGLIAGPFWWDKKGELTDNDSSMAGYYVYPWNRSKSLGRETELKEGYIPAILKSKILSNLRYSYKTLYYDNEVLEYTGEGFSGRNYKEYLHLDITKPVLFASEEIEPIKLEAPKNASLDYYYYYGNISKLEVPPYSYYNFIITDEKFYPQENDIKSDYFYKNGYSTAGKEGLHVALQDAVSIEYKSTPHIVIPLTSDEGHLILPTIGNANINDKVGPTTQDYGGVNHIPRTPIETNSHYYPFWENGESYEIIQNVVPSLPGIYEEPDEKSYNLGHGYLWLGELYREVNPETLFGGTSTAALETNKWQIAGPSTKLVRDKDCIIKYLEGDTYYQRYDHLKTYPSSIENPNSIVEIISFMCETNINIDGRYDNNRGLKSNLTINPQNFNKLNTAYSQSNNFFTYNLLSEDFKNTKFPNSVVWSLSKILGERIDSWTSFNLSSNLDIPPSLGIIRSIEYFKNNLIVFQDTTLSIINYNEKYTITTTQGVPVEIANSGKVDGYTIIDEYSGTKNKWNIVKTPEGIIFIDTLDKKIKRYNGENIEPLTTSKGFSVWANKNIYNAEEWYPTVLKEQSPNYTVYYDSNTEDVYFLYKFYDYSGGVGLAYNNDIQKFSSFYPYYKFNYILNIANKSLGILTNEEGYSYIYELYKSRISNEYFLNDYYITFFLQDQQYFTDKIFTNIEFRASSIDDKNNLNNFNNFLPFNLISIETETSKYQTGEEILKYDRFQISNLKKKFNIWRANIPRDSRSNYGLDRIRNPWAYLTLKSDSNSNTMEFRDLITYYYQ